VAEETAAIAELDADIAKADERQGALSRSQKRLDDEVAMIVQKIQETDRTLYGGTVTNRRELEALQAELAALKRRQRSLEDEDLDIMEQLEPVEAGLEKLRTLRADRTTVLTGHQERLAAASAELEAEIAQVNKERAESVVGIGDDLLEEYEQLRRAPGGIGVARLVGSTCTGCNLSLSNVEVSKIRKLPPGEVAHCEECGRLLVP
jgi:predicted  nucleic acid-binding Zn-ribbon protein